MIYLYFERVLEKVFFRKLFRLFRFFVLIPLQVKSIEKSIPFATNCLKSTGQLSLVNKTPIYTMQYCTAFYRRSISHQLLSVCNSTLIYISYLPSLLGNKSKLHKTITNI